LPEVRFHKLLEIILI